MEHDETGLGFLMPLKYWLVLAERQLLFTPKK